MCHSLIYLPGNYQDLVKVFVKLPTASTGLFTAAVLFDMYL